MPSPRWLARLAVPMMLGAALITGAASAGASPTDDAYLAQLRGFGFTWPRATRRPSSGWHTSSATISGGVGRQTILPSTYTPTWTRTALGSDKSDPW